MNCSSIKGFDCLIRKISYFPNYLLVVIESRGNELSNYGSLIEGDHDLLAGLGNWGLSVCGSDLRCQFSPCFIVIVQVHSCWLGNRCNRIHLPVLPSACFNSLIPLIPILLV